MFVVVVFVMDLMSNLGNMKFPLIKERNILKKRQDDNKTCVKEDVKLISVEENIAELLAEEGRSKAYQFKKFCCQNGSVNQSEMGKLKKKLWPKRKESIQTGKINHQGKLITRPEDLKKLLEKEYSERLRPRPYNPSIKDLEMVKKEVFETKLKEAIANKSPDWNMEELDRVLKDINQNKSRDPAGLNRIIFHPSYIGSNLKQ